MDEEEDFVTKLDRSIENLEREYKINRLNNQLLEQKMYQRQMMNFGNSDFQGVNKELVDGLFKTVNNSDVPESIRENAMQLINEIISSKMEKSES